VIRPVRRSVSSPGGQADLVKYAKAVGIMMGLPASDARSWTYQWYIHSVPNDRTKASELQRLYPTAGAGRALAAETWSTCRSHFGGMNADDFLPWHRMYLMCFETTLRSILNDPTFCLPYWNYLNPAQRALPAAFRAQAHPQFGVLYRTSRNSGPNGGAAIDAGAPGLINADALSRPTYRPSGLRPGFCEYIDGLLHGNVHVRVGNGRGMGNIPWAANDPIFWLHHANIDRLWASWNANGGRNPGDPAWIQQAFVFPNGTGGRASIRNGQVATLQSAGYGYDVLEPGPTIIAPTAGPVERPVIILDQAVRPTIISPSGAAVPLRRVNRPRITGVAGARMLIVLSDLSAPDTPGVVYQVDLRDPGRQWVTVGHINFFESVMSEGMAGHGPARRFTFDVTDLVAGMRGRPEVRIVPVGNPEGGVSVTVGRVELIQN
jgi:tyrosinase